MLGNKKSASARGIASLSGGTSALPPVTRRRQSLTVYERTGPGHTPEISWQCSVEQWDYKEGAGGKKKGKAGSNSGENSFIGRSLRDAMRELARPTVQLCLGPVAADDALGVAICHPGPHAISTSPFMGRRLSRSHSPSVTSALLLGNALAQAAVIEPRHYHSHHQLSANRSPSVSGASIAPGMGGRRGSERVGRLERSNSLLGGRGGNSHLPFLPELSPQQVSNLRRSWKHVNTKGLYDVIRRAFRRVESSNSSARTAFRQNDPPSPSSGAGKPLPSGGDTAAGAGCPKPHASSAAAATSVQTTGCGVMEHTRYFLTLLDRIIDGDQEGIERELRLVGARHVPTFEHFGLGVAELERLGEAVAESFFKLDGIRQSKETTKVWRTLIAHIIDHIRDGFETELRLHRRRTSSLLATGGSPAAMAMAPLESRFCKRNSVPGPRKESSSQQSSTASSTAVLNVATNAGAFLRTELANLTRKLSNL